MDIRLQRVVSRATCMYVHMRMIDNSSQRRDWSDESEFDRGVAGRMDRRLEFIPTVHTLGGLFVVCVADLNHLPVPSNPYCFFSVGMSCACQELEERPGLARGGFEFRPTYVEVAAAGGGGRRPWVRTANIGRSRGVGMQVPGTQARHSDCRIPRHLRLPLLCRIHLGHHDARQASGDRGDTCRLHISRTAVWLPGSAVCHQQGVLRLHDGLTIVEQAVGR